MRHKFSIGLILGDCPFLQPREAFFFKALRCIFQRSSFLTRIQAVRHQWLRHALSGYDVYWTLHTSHSDNRNGTLHAEIAAPIDSAHFHKRQKSLLSLRMICRHCSTAQDRCPLAKVSPAAFSWPSVHSDQCLEVLDAPFVLTHSKHENLHFQLIRKAKLVTSVTTSSRVTTQSRRCEVFQNTIFGQHGHLNTIVFAGARQGLRFS